MIFLLFLVLNLAMASDDGGGVDGGGGNGVICRSADETITDVRMLDLYEGEILSGLQFSDRFTSIESALKEVASKLHSPHLEYMFLAAYQNFKLLPSGVRLEPIDDSGHIFIPGNCKIEQIANYYNSNTIYVVSDFFNQMSLTDKVALIVHETIYTIDRAQEVENSRYARRVTAHALSDNFSFEDPREGAPTKSGLLCTTPTIKGIYGNKIGSYVLNPELKKNTSFWAIKRDDGFNNWRFQFINLNGHTVYSKTYIDVRIDQSEFDFPMMPLLNVTSNEHSSSVFSSLMSTFDMGQSFSYEFESKEADLNMFSGPKPSPGSWMKDWSSNYMYLSWTGFDPGDEVYKAQFLCSELIIYIP